LIVGSANERCLFRIASRAWRTAAQPRPGDSPTSKLFCQAFPKFGLFSPRISKESFGVFVEFQGVTVDANPKKRPFQIFVFSSALEPRLRSQTRLDQ
jgi:hypothetical protein